MNDTACAAMRARQGLDRLLVWSPGQRDIIKTVALVLMVLDHANRILHLDQTWMFLAGLCPGVGAESVLSCAYPAVGY